VGGLAGQLVRAILGISAPAFVAMLEQAALRGGASDEVAGGANVRVVARRFGIETRRGIEMLED
jgi:hypothetical protein